MSCGSPSINCLVCDKISLLDTSKWLVRSVECSYLYLLYLGMTTSSVILVKCDACGWTPFAKTEDYVQLALWPADSQGSIFFEFSYMFHISVLQHFSPGLSFGSMVQTLQFITSMNSNVSSQRLCQICIIIILSNFSILYLIGYT